MEKKCEEKMALLDKYNTEIIEPLKNVINKKEEEKKKVNIDDFYNRYFLKIFKDYLRKNEYSMNLKLFYFIILISLANIIL